MEFLQAALYRQKLLKWNTGNGVCATQTYCGYENFSRTIESRKE